MDEATEMPCARMDAHGAHRWTLGDGTRQAQCLGIGSHPELLTETEHEAVELAGRVAVLLDRIVPDGPTRAGDLAELCGHVHVLQNAVLAQAAARAYPGRYRLMGATVVQGGTEWFANDGRTPLLPTAGQSGDLLEWVCDRPEPHAGHPLGRRGLSCPGRLTAAPTEAPCRVCDGRGRTHRLGCPEADRTDPLPRDMTFSKPGLTGDSSGDLERFAAWSGLDERRCQLATAHDEHGWRPVPGAHTMFRCPGLPGGEASFPAGTEVTVDGSALTAPAGDFDAEVYPTERCRDPWTPDAHEPHRWRPADDPTWRFCDGRQLVHDELPVRRCRNNSEHRSHRWGTRLEDPPVPAGLASDAPTLAWCPGLTLELKGVRTVREGELTKWGDPDWRSYCERASAVAVGAGAPDDGATLPEQVEWLAAELHGPSLRPSATVTVRAAGVRDPLEVGLPGMSPASYDLRELARVLRHAAVDAQEQGRAAVTVPAWALGRVADRAHGTTVLQVLVTETDQRTTPDGTVATLRGIDWAWWDRVQLDPAGVAHLLEQIDHPAVVPGSVVYYPPDGTHYAVVEDREGTPHLRSAKVGDFGGEPAGGCTDTKPHGHHRTGDGDGSGEWCPGVPS